jgi:recombination protein RecA
MANMAAPSSALRSQIEAALANRIPSALTPAPRTIRPVMPTGVAPVDQALNGGLPAGALTEIVGAECSGRTSLALSFVGQATRAGKVCAWVDVSDALCPESAASCGIDLSRMLWVRCGVTHGRCSPAVEAEECVRAGHFSLPQRYFLSRPAIKGLHGGGMGGHPRDEAKGMDDAVSGLLQTQRTVQFAGVPARTPVSARQPDRKPVLPSVAAQRRYADVAGRPWGRIEQGLKAMDLLLQAGGFATVVLDMGAITAEQVSRIPLATWFRYRAAAERTQAIVLLLTQHACAKSSAQLVLRMESGDAVTQGATVLVGFERRMEVVRRRFAESEEKVVPIRKPPQRAGAAPWRCEAGWAVPR